MIDLFIQNQRSEATRRNYAYDLNKWFTFLGDRTPDEKIALDWRDHLEATMKVTSAARIFNTVRGYYKWARLYNPFEHIKSPRVTRNRTPKVPSDMAVNAMLKMCGSTRDRAVITLLLNGLRSDEVTRLTMEDWKFEPDYQTYIISVKGKGDKNRPVPANADTIQMVNGYLSMRNTASPWLLQHDRSGSRFTTRQVQYVCERWSGYAIRPHQLRHHYATRLIRGGANVFAVKDLLGHSNISTTQVYVNLDLADIVKAAGVDPRNKKEQTVDHQEPRQ